MAYDPSFAWGGLPDIEPTGQPEQFTAAMHGEVAEVLGQAADMKFALLSSPVRAGVLAGQDLNDRNVAPGSAWTWVNRWAFTTP